MKRSLIVVALLSGSLLSAGEFEMGLGAQLIKPDGKFKYGSSSTSTEVDLSEDLGIDDQKVSIKPYLQYTFGKNRVFANYEYYSSDSTERLNKNIEFDNKIYSAGTNLYSKLEYNWFQTGYRYLALDKKESYSLGVGADINVIKMKMELNNNIQNASFDETVPLPTLVADGRVNIYKSLALKGKAAFLPTGKVDYQEYYGGLTWECAFIDNAILNAGYQYKRLDMDVNDMDGHIDFSGLYVGAGYRFQTFPLHITSPLISFMVQTQIMQLNANIPLKRFKDEG
eukprot:TRINITY_DN143987_c0_g1_i1.p1 TRINITY_DN143987_c0_g1~~TRINITY_DN143987_c0_g1_i1.p1  ORF type:complete len:306 (-),score=10.78 TRINITY_DN143987_c0_g1_i1:50-898(-)